MTIYSLYIYDRRVHFQNKRASRRYLTRFFIQRHCACIYYQDWHRTKRPKPAVEGGIMPAVSRAISPQPPITDTMSHSTFSSPRNTLSSNSGIVVAMSDMLQQIGSPLQAPAPAQPAPPSSGLPFDEEAKLVYGVILSLRNMVRKLSGRSADSFRYLGPRILTPSLQGRTVRRL
jgi:hypothetical protein